MIPFLSDGAVRIKFMAFPDIFAATLGLSQLWEITDVSFSTAEKRMDITVTYPSIDSIICPICGAVNKMCYTAEEVWFHGDFFKHATYLHTQVPYFQCCELLSVERPWSRLGSKFALLS